jgi:hypothetical protein
MAHMRKRLGSLGSSLAPGTLFVCAVLSLAFSACSIQGNYKPSSAPIYALDDSGIYAFDGTNWSLTSQAAARSGMVSAAAEKVGLYGRGSYSFAVNEKGLDVFSSGELKMSFPPDCIVPGSSKVNCAIVDSSCNIMAGTDKGFAILYSGASSFKNQLPSPASVNGLYIDKEDYVYVASSSGLYKLGVGAVLIFAKGEVLCVYADESSDTIYVGTESGIEASSNGGASWMEVLSGHAIRAIWRDPSSGYSLDR